MRSRFLRRAAAALSRRVVHGYPKPWRDRYAGEVLALLDDSPARLRDVVDLTRGLVVERARATFEPGDRPTLLATVVFVAGFVRAVTLATPPILCGWAVQYWLGPASRTVRNGTALVCMLFILAFMVCVRRASRSSTNPSEPKRLSNRAARIYLGAAIPITFLMSWTASVPVHYLGVLWLFGPVWDHLEPCTNCGLDETS
jgi:hypothetical protein